MSDFDGRGKIYQYGVLHHPRRTKDGSSGEL
jgi:hypothetical protein